MNWKEIRDELDRYALQMLGAAWLAVAWIFEIVWQEAGTCLFFLIAAGIIDLLICHHKLDTITKWVRRQWGMWPDLIFTIGGLILTSWCVAQWPEIRWYDVSLLCVVFAIKGHLFLND